MALNPSISSLSSWSSQLEDELAGADKRLDRMVQQTDEALTTVNGASECFIFVLYSRSYWSFLSAAISAPPSEIVKSLNEVKQELQNMKSEVPIAGPSKEFKVQLLIV